MKIENLTIKKASQFLTEKKISSVELTNYCLNKIKETNQIYNSLITIDKKGSLDSAKKSDERRSKNQSLSVLDGIPTTLKDIILTKDLRTTAASKMLDNFIPPFDATVTKKLKNSGAVILGKNNCDAWAHGASTEHSDYGVAKNPHDISRVPGGSSGGSAISVSSGQSIYSIGTDTGGSIRQPASFCGIVGLKPTYGRVSRYGLVAMASSLDCPGPMTKNVEDSAILMNFLAGYDKNDSNTLNDKSPDYTKFLKKDIKSLKIGLPREYFIDGTQSEIKINIKKVIENLEKHGAKIKELSLPHTKYTVPTYYIIQPAEVSSNLGRYDGIKYGYHSGANSLIETYFKSRQEGFGDEAKRRIIIGTYTLSSGYYEAYYLKASKVRTLIKQDFEKAFNEVDVLITPTAPTTAFKIGENEKDPVKMYLADVFTAGPSLAGVPAISIPVGFDKKKLPIGMQIIAPQFREDLLIQMGAYCERINS